MPRVFNWQIGREMDFPYEGSRPKRQFSAVFDTNKCIACQTCSLACKGAWTSGRGQEYMFWNNVESKPYGYFPLGWDVTLLEKLGVPTRMVQGRRVTDAYGTPEEYVRDLRTSVKAFATQLLTLAPDAQVALMEFGQAAVLLTALLHPKAYWLRQHAQIEAP